MTHLRWRPPDLSPPSTVVLTPRQADVLTALCHGLTNGQTARRLGTTENTIKEQTKRLYRELGVHDRAGAVAVAMSGHCTVLVKMGRAA